MNRRFESARNKFWEIRLDGETLTTRSGTIGTDGRATIAKKLASVEKAQKEAAKKIAEQIAKHSTEVTQTFEAEPSNPALEKQIVEEPTDSGRCLVYADWLQGQGHPRGELGVLQSQRATRPDDAGLAKAEQKILEKHPELAPQRCTEAAKKQRKSNTEDDGHAITWENGFIAAARLARNSDKSPFTVRELVAELLAHPAARFLRELRIGALGPDMHDYAPVIDEIIRGCPSTLRVLSLVDLPPGSAELVFADLADVTALLAATPLLEELRLAGNKVQVKGIDLPKLRRLAVATSDPEILAAVARAKLPSLQSLQLSSGDAPMPAGPLAKVLGTKSAQQLAITRTANTDELVPFLAKSELLEKITWLDLSGGKLTDAGASAIVAARAKFEHLEYLDLSGNALTAQSTKPLTALCKTVRLDNQRAAGTNASISESDLRRMSPDASALAKGREVSKPSLWPTLGRDGDMYWGTCRGSDTYEVYVRVPSLENGCSCPSGKRPCKHTIGLAILVSSGHRIDAREAPGGFTRRATSNRYYGGWE
jgi:uncharacterized protein (TIGR02996 family)